MKKQQKTSIEKCRNEISRNDSDDTTRNLKMPRSSKFSLLTQRNSKETNKVAKELCFFSCCIEGNLHMVLRFGLDAEALLFPKILEDNFLLGKIGAGDMVTLDCNVSCKMFDCSF